MVSKNRRQGAARRAFLKTLRSAFSDSPSHFEKSCGPSTAMSGSPVSPDSARAIVVFPVPDAPGEEDAARRRQPDLLVQLVMHVAVLDDGAQQPLDLVEPAHGVEADARFSRAGIRAWRWAPLPSAPEGSPPP